MKARPTQSRKGVKGQLPLAGSRDSVPCGVWGNAPTVPRATSMPNALNKGAGSEASLPVTLRVRRRAPKLLFCASRGFAPAGATKGLSDRPLETFGAATFGVVCGLTFIVAGKIALADANLSIIALLWDGNPRRRMQKSPEL